MTGPVTRWYLKFLRDIKRKGIRTEDAPPEVQRSLLAVHQMAQMEWIAQNPPEKRKKRKPKK